MREFFTKLSLERWRNRMESGKGPIVTDIDISRPIGAAAPLKVHVSGYQERPGTRRLQCHPWGQAAIEGARWKRDLKLIVEKLMSVESPRELDALELINFQPTENTMSRGFYEKNTKVALSRTGPKTGEIFPWKGSDRTAVGVTVLGQTIDLGLQDGRVQLRMPANEFADLVDEQLYFAEVVSSNKLPRALELLAAQGVSIRPYSRLG